MTEQLRLVGLREIAELLHVQPDTPNVWRARGVLPEPEWVVSGTPVWRLETIVGWARESGRLP